MTVSATILGCGGSAGMPAIGPWWGKCDPAHLRNRRTRTSIYIDFNGVKILVDTSPDLRTQCLRQQIRTLDAIIWTHDHADHTHGLDDVRTLARHSGGPIPGFADSQTLDSLAARFSYAFKETDPGSFYRPFIQGQLIQLDLQSEILIKGQVVRIFPQKHGKIQSLGLRFGDLAYSTDVCALPEEAFSVLAGVKIWIVDCLTWHKHPTHGSWEVVQQWINRIRPEQVFLTHLGGDMDYETVLRETPNHVAPAFDGLVVTIKG